MYEEDNQVRPFIVSFLLTLLVIGGVCGGLTMVGRVSAPTVAQEEEYAGPATLYLPKKEERLILLLAGREDTETAPDIFLLAGFLPDKGKLALCLLPPKTLIPTGEQWGTLGELYDRGGVAYAAKEAGRAFGISITRTATLETKGLTTLMEKLGPFDYYNPVELDYPLHQRQVLLRRGPHQLDGRGLADVLAYPAYKGGEQERSDRGAMLLTQLVNQHLPSCLTPQGEGLVKAFLNCCETDLSYKDYEERSTSVRFLATLSLPAATAVYVEGALSRDYSTFVLTESCRARIQSVYNGDGFPLTPQGGRQEVHLGAYDRVEEAKPQPTAEPSPE